MPDYTSDTAADSDLWSTPAAAGAAAATGLPQGVPGLPTGSTGQSPAPAPVGPRADAQPVPPAAAPGPLQAPIPGATPWYQGIKDFFTGKSEVGDYKGGGTFKGSTDGSRDIPQTAGQQKKAIEDARQSQSTPYKDMY